MSRLNKHKKELTPMICMSEEHMVEEIFSETPKSAVVSEGQEDIPSLISPVSFRRMLAG